MSSAILPGCVVKLFCNPSVAIMFVCVNLLTEKQKAYFMCNIDIANEGSTS